MKKYKVNVNGTVYEVTVEAMDGAAPAANLAQAMSAGNEAEQKLAELRRQREEGAEIDPALEAALRKQYRTR